MLWVFDLDEDQSRKQRGWAEMGFKVRIEFIMGVGTERTPGLVKDAGILFRRVAHCLPSRIQGIVTWWEHSPGGLDDPLDPLSLLVRVGPEVGNKMEISIRAEYGGSCL